MIASTPTMASRMLYNSHAGVDRLHGIGDYFSLVKILSFKRIYRQIEAGHQKTCRRQAMLFDDDCCRCDKADLAMIYQRHHHEALFRLGIS